jgi:hypothetical protein
MTWRATAHDYTRAGVYHITIHVADELGQVLGKVAGNLSAPDGSTDAPHTALSPVGQMVEYELMHTIHAFYPMITIQNYVIMPEHLHALMVVQDRIVSQNGKIQTIGQVIAGFKLGCNRRFWEITQRGDEKRAEPAEALIKERRAEAALALTNERRAEAAGALTNERRAEAAGALINDRQPLFNPGYCDVIPVDDAQLATQRAYIAANPRSRLLRTSNHSMLMPQRGGIDTAITLTALRGFLQRECPAHLVNQEALCQLELRLLMADGKIICDSYGDRRLLTQRCLPVVCHRKDAARFSEQKRRCLEEAERGTVLVSARIAKGEQEIMDEALRRGFQVALVVDNGFPEVYHPSAERIEYCATGKMLLVSPWQYQYRKKDDAVSVPFCKTMNCVAQALCRTKDTWWKG